MISEVQLIRICGLGPSLSNVPTETQISLVVGVVLCQSLLTTFQEVENVYFDFATMLIFFSELKCRGSNTKKYVKIASLRDLVAV